ncbi:MAG: hypothetical protein K0R05_231 [Anaerocolumna sp.]|jgi:hypothetical protein|nr:hypothetical protein [Anaerocolumna sp.]
MALNMTDIYVIIRRQKYISSKKEMISNKKEMKTVKGK